jgi:16S rRNA (adenine1518-N6/adenine1519-N6)-dimethyltransferase
VMGSYRAKKRLGQNFLKSQVIIDKLVELIDPRPGERIVEIGPGRGALTIALAPSGALITAVEYDRDLIGYLTKLAAPYPGVRIINRDFLDFQPDCDSFKLVGNIPYNLTSPVVDWAVAHSSAISLGVLMVQMEVAERLASSPGSKNWSPAAIMTQLHFDIRLCFEVAAKHFRPPPKVVSAVIELAPRRGKKVTLPGQFERVVRASFRHRRKTLVNNLVTHLSPDRKAIIEVLQVLNLTERIRAEEVTTEQFLELTKLLVARTILHV